MAHPVRQAAWPKANSGGCSGGVSLPNSITTGQNLSQAVFHWFSTGGCCQASGYSAGVRTQALPLWDHHVLLGHSWMRPGNLGCKATSIALSAGRGNHSCSDDHTWSSGIVWGLWQARVAIPDENWRRWGTPLFSGAGGVPGRQEWEWRGYPWAKQTQTKIVISCSAASESTALLEYQIHQRDRKCCPDEGLSVEVNKTVWVALGDGAWRDTLSQDFCRASSGEILGEERIVKGNRHFSFLLFPFKCSFFSQRRPVSCAYLFCHCLYSCLSHNPTGILGHKWHFFLSQEKKKRKVWYQYLLLQLWGFNLKN